ncbi:MAG: 4'-phosphopantetheinyl transferase superfamily protein [Gammaproteobacteria bacterium]|nr:4'-phosphopantetheinyl transferase superfamily protein [Gammaproteobacteria bacterium]
MGLLSNIACRTSPPRKFFACWTRKEAVAKALGDGLAHGLNKLDAGFQEDEQADKRISLQDAAGQEWSVQNLPLEPGW